MFDAARREASFRITSIRRVESTWDFGVEEIAGELQRMESLRLATIDNESYLSATLAGRIAREQRWQELQRRHPALSDPAALLCDLVLALVVSGEEDGEPVAHSTFRASALEVYLWRRTAKDIQSAIEALSSAGLIRQIGDAERLRGIEYQATAEGAIHYAKNVIGTLGLRRSDSILAPLDSEAESPLFDGLGLAQPLIDNLQYRWEEAARCRGARAWLAVTILYGSILEALLLPSLASVPARAMASNKAPKDRAGAVRSLDDWTLEGMLNVAADIGMVEPSLARFCQALRDTRNLVHPQKQLRERSRPDIRVVEISSQVIRGVVESLRAQYTARAASTP